MTQETSISKEKDLLRITLHNEQYTVAAPITERLTSKVEYAAFKQSSLHSKDIDIVVQGGQDSLEITIETIEGIIKDIEDVIEQLSN